MARNGRDINQDVGGVVIRRKAGTRPVPVDII